MVLKLLSRARRALNEHQDKELLSSRPEDPLSLRDRCTLVKPRGATGKGIVTRVTSQGTRRAERISSELNRENQARHSSSNDADDATVGGHHYAGDDRDMARIHILASVRGHVQ